METSPSLPESILQAQSPRPPFYPGSAAATHPYLSADQLTSSLASPSLSNDARAFSNDARTFSNDGNTLPELLGAGNADKLDDAYADEYGKKLQLIERVRHEVDLDDVKTPGIVVIGSQSAGKSSVLARLTGIAFPTGDNICTRSPIIVHTVVDSSLRSFSAELSDDAAFNNSIRCTSPAQLRDEITNVTARVARDATSITDTPIYVRHTRRSGPVMTLIDLPGITHLDPANDGYDIHSATTSLVRQYVQDDNLIMLVVIPATDDFANSEALRIAQEYDSHGERTIGVVSKCDMLPQACDIVDKINMTRPSDIKLALGFVAVRNRARGDGADEDLDVAERRLFSNHPQLRRLKNPQRGIHALTVKVVALQGNAVERSFASLRAQLWDAKHAAKARLESLPVPPASADARRDVLIDVLTDIQSRVSALVRTDDLSVPHLNVPARTFEMCTRFGENIVDQVPNCLKADFVNAVRTKQAEGRGRLLPDADIDTVIPQQVREILFGGPTTRARGGVVQKCTDDLINAVMMFMVRCYETIIHEETERANLPALAAAICSQLSLFMEGARKHATHITGSILSAERSICYTQNTLYTNVMREVRRVATTGNIINDDAQRKSLVEKLLKRDGDSSLLKDCPMLSVAPSLFPQDNVVDDDYASFLDRFIAEAASQSDTWSLMRAQFSIHCYLHVVIKRLCDIIPMVVRNILVYELHAGFLPHISKALLKEPAILEDAMREGRKDKENRKTLESKYAKLEDVLSKMLELGVESEANGEQEG